MTPDSRPIVTPRLIAGIALSVFGILLALGNADVIDAGQYLRYWPVALMAMGAALIMQSRNGSNSIGGMILVAAGGWLLLNTLDIIDVGLWDVFWPLALILIGANLIRGTLRRTEGSASDTVNLMAILSGVERSAGMSNFRGGELIAFMGGCDLDLRQATLPPGGEATIDCFAMMGGMEIKVPKTWVVDSRVLPVMGGIEDGTVPPSGDVVANPPRLLLRGLVIMGGIEIKN